MRKIFKTILLTTLLCVFMGCPNPAETDSTDPIAPVAPVAPTPIPTVFAVGDIGPSGGYIFYDAGNDDQGWRYLEMAPTNTPEKKPWGSVDMLIDGVDDRTNSTLGSGLASTANIILNDPLADNAAKACVDYSVTNNGVTYDDWYLPSQKEAYTMFTKLKEIASITNTWYWTSSQADKDNGRIQQMGLFFASANGPKGDLYKIRPVRKF